MYIKQNKIKQEHKNIKIYTIFDEKKNTHPYSYTGVECKMYTTLLQGYCNRVVCKITSISNSPDK